MSTPAGPIVEVRGLVKRFGSRPALVGIDAEVWPGEAVVLTGVNGSGKTTFLRVLAGALRPEAGCVRVAGHDVVANRQTASRFVGVLGSREHSWYPMLTARQNLAFFARLAGHDRGAVDRAIVDVGLERDRDRPVAAFSAGMRARLGLARAWLGNPLVLLLDEPTDGLDAPSTAAFLDRMSRRGATAVILSTHSPQVTAAVGDRVLRFAGGRIAATEEVAAAIDRAAP